MTKNPRSRHTNSSLSSTKMVQTVFVINKDCENICLCSTSVDLFNVTVAAQTQAVIFSSTSRHNLGKPLCAELTYWTALRFRSFYLWDIWGGQERSLKENKQLFSISPHTPWFSSMLIAKGSVSLNLNCCLKESGNKRPGMRDSLVIIASFWRGRPM